MEERECKEYRIKTVSRCKRSYKKNAKRVDRRLYGAIEACLEALRGDLLPGKKPTGQLAGMRSIRVDDFAYRIAFGTGYSYRIFDFGHAFGGPAWTADSVKMTYKVLARILKFCLITGCVEAPGDLGRFFRALESHPERWLDGFVGSLTPGLGPDARADAEALKSARVALKRDALEEAALKAGVLQG